MRTAFATAVVLVTALGLLVLAGLWSAAAKAQPPEPPEQGKIAFVRLGDFSGFGGEIWVMNDDGSGQARLTKGAPDLAPAWSPDGQRIAFTRYRRSPADPPPRSDLWVMNADGSDDQNITNNPDNPPHSDTSPTWSPDGQRIAFASNRDWSTLAPPRRAWFVSRIWAMDADGTDPATLTTWDLPFHHDPAWSPDGERIASSGDGIWVMSPDGSDQTRIADGFSPAWSPDGQRIAFVEDDWVSEWESGSFLSVMNADGSDVTRLIRDAGSPTWSPDGERIAFTRPRDSETHPALSDIWAMNADGSCLTPLLRGPTRDTSPAWHPLSPPSQPQVCFTLSVSTSGTGTGRVTGPGIRCQGFGEAECRASFAAGTQLALGATPSQRSGFAGWAGTCTGTGPCRLTMNGDREANAHFGTPRVRVRARPRQRRVGADRRRVRYRFVARNVGDSPWRIHLCARDPQRRVRVLGERCVTRRIPPGARRQRVVRVRIRPAARGGLTRIRLTARLGPGVENQQTIARLRVRQ